MVHEIIRVFILYTYLPFVLNYAVCNVFRLDQLYNDFFTKHRPNIKNLLLLL